MEIGLQQKQAVCMVRRKQNKRTKTKREVRSSPDGKLQNVSYRSRPSILREHKKSVDEFGTVDDFGTTNTINTIDVETQKLSMLQLQV